uniref:Uncharacterized protein n=1 Tax=Anguilla anguilla TaxID=7936 RepID=A0A0E9TY44_ANGAN
MLAKEPVTTPALTCTHVHLKKSALQARKCS